MVNKPRFSQVLLDAGAVTEAQIKAALKQQAITGELLGSILQSQGVLTEKQVAFYLGKTYEVPSVVISEFIPDATLQKKIPKEIAEKFQILPLRLQDRVLTVAAANPQDFRMLQEVEFMTGCSLRVHVAMRSALRKRIERYYSQIVTAEEMPSNYEISFDPSITGTAMPITSIADDLGTKDLREAQKLAKSAASPSIPLQEIKKTGATILVVDDDATIRTLLEDALKSKNYTVLTAARGREAVQKIQTVRPDLILLDAMLPEIHGFTICKTLKDSQKYRDIPVMIITAVYTGWRFAMDVKDNYGANDVLEKPFKIQDVLIKVKQLLEESASAPDDIVSKDVALSRKAEDYLQAGMKFFLAGQIQEALVAFKQGIQIDQLHPMLHYYEGKCYEAMKDPFNALAAMEKAIDIDAHLFPALKDIAILYQQNGFKRKAIEMWERAAQLCTDPAMKEKIKQNLLSLL